MVADRVGWVRPAQPFAHQLASRTGSGGQFAQVLAKPQTVVIPQVRAVRSLDDREAVDLGCLFRHALAWYPVDHALCGAGWATAGCVLSGEVASYGSELEAFAVVLKRAAATHEL